MDKEQCEAGGGTWDDATMMCTHPEDTGMGSVEDASDTDREPESM